METIKRIIHTIKETDVNVWLFGGLSIIFILIGNIHLNQNPPNFQIGYPTTAMGFAFFVFAVSIDNSKKSAKKMNQILEKLNDIQGELKKNNDSDHELGSNSKNNGE